MYPGMIYAPQPSPYRCELGGSTPSECAILCAQAVEDLILTHGPETIAAFIGEPVSSNAGNAVPGDEYWPMIRDICDRYGVLLVADEVITGYGRTGQWFGMNHWDVVPDIMGSAKGIISSYLPFAATIAKSEIADAFAGKDDYFRMTNSFGGHPVAAAAALKNLEIIESEGMVENSAKMGEYFREQLRELQDDYQFIGDVRGIGLMNTVELVSDRDTKAKFDPELRIQERLGDKFYEKGLILQPTGHFINMSSPLCITAGDIDEIVSILDETFRELTAEVPELSG
jgi:adenosylmethionine-8-amino-7-oxononanoate aminotransferase